MLKQCSPLLVPCAKLVPSPLNQKVSPSKTSEALPTLRLEIL
jgi:hypothetical protein